MDLSSLKPAPGAKSNRKRLGRGPGSGLGSQSGKGHKGQKSRSGYKSRAWHEGGQMPMNRRLPKRGFTNIFKTISQVVNLNSLEKLNLDVIDKDVLYSKKLIRRKRIPVKILGTGDITKPLTVKAHAFSKTAIEKIEKAGGKAEVIKC
ncbi:MAG: 50S ribosomal protein L15 [candidate division Zixibacteria bacterium]|nr:50S ribosomal protein L15 [candidate division Zixibacteria bacterium]